MAVKSILFKHFIQGGLNSRLNITILRASKCKDFGDIFISHILDTVDIYSLTSSC